MYSIKMSIYVSYMGVNNLEKGIVFNIQRYSIHDGPGIRTTVFFKGCPLNCWWCHNPESQSARREVIYYKNRCAGCGACSKSCPEGAIEIKEGMVIRDTERCSLCGECVSKCPAGAHEMMGKVMTTEEIINEVEKDIIFYDESGGGVTLSGGEPLMQLAPVKELIGYFHKNGINVAVDTCGYLSWDRLAETAPLVDIFLYDLKFIDSNQHRKYTGKGNEKIIDNLASLANGRAGKNNYSIIGRIPLIPGVNDDKDNITGIGRFLSNLGIADVNLLPYHDTGSDKYHRLGMEYKLAHIEPLTDERIEYLRSLLIDSGLQVKIGG